MRAVVSVLIVCATGPMVFGQTLPPGVLVVDHAATAGGNGLSWPAAFNDLQVAIEAAAASGGVYRELWLRHGTYTARDGGGGCVTPYVLDGLEVYGGFSGNETEREQRDLSGPATILDGSAYPFLYEQGCGPVVTLQNAAVLDGAQIIGANVDQTVSAVRVGNACTLRRVRIDGFALRGSVISVGSPGGPPANLENCFVRGTSASGIHFRASDAVMRSCDIYARSTSNAWRAMQIDDIRLEDTLLRASADAGHSIYGGSIHAVRSEIVVGAEWVAEGARLESLTMDRSRLTSNMLSGGYGVVANQFVARESVFASGAGSRQLTVGDGGLFVNCQFLSGSGSYQQIDGWFGSSARFVSCTFRRTIPSGTGLLARAVNHNWTFKNCVIWGDGTVYNQASGVVGALSNCCVRGYTPSMGGVGNIAADPLLDADGALQTGSPCIDAGDNALLQADQSVDYLGQCRIVDGDGNGSAVVDMGAIEFGACYANCDCSTSPPILNAADFACFLQRFAAGGSVANCDQSTRVPVLNVADFTCFLQRFAAGCP